jgi:hypothetical protein
VLLSEELEEEEELPDLELAVTLFCFALEGGGIFSLLHDMNIMPEKKNKAAVRSKRFLIIQD